MTDPLDAALDVLWTDNDLKDVIPVLKSGCDSYYNGLEYDLSAHEYLLQLSLEVQKAGDLCKSAEYRELARLLGRIDDQLHKLGRVGRKGVQEVVVELNNLWAAAREELAAQEAKQM